MSTAIATRLEQHGASLLERVVVIGDLAQLKPEERVAYYRAVCESVGLNPLTRPFEYITLNGRLTLYARKDCTDQLRALRAISVTRLEREVAEGIYTVTAYGQDRSGRTDSALGAVPIEGIKGEVRANAMMKAETKAKRRLTLSLAGLGWLDEVEVESVPSAQRTDVDPETGEILRTEAPKSLADKVAARRAEVVGGPPAAQDAPPVSGAPPGDSDPPGPSDAPDQTRTVAGAEPASGPTAAAVPSAAAVTPAEQARQVFGDDIAEPTGLSSRELAQRIADAGVAMEVVLAAAKHLYGAGRKLGELTDAERLALWRKVEPSR